MLAILYSWFSKLEVELNLLKRLAVHITTNAYLKDKRRYIRIGKKLTPSNKQCYRRNWESCFEEAYRMFLLLQKIPYLSTRFKIKKLNVDFFTCALFSNF